MRVLILRNPGLDLIHDLKTKGIDVPKDCLEGETKDLSKAAAEALIELHLAEPLDRKPAEHEPPARQDKPPSGEKK